MNLSDEIWLPANILFPDAPGSRTAGLELSLRVPLPADSTVARKITLADLLADAVLFDLYASPDMPGRRSVPITEPPFPGEECGQQP